MRLGCFESCLLTADSIRHMVKLVGLGCQYPRPDSAFFKLKILNQIKKFWLKMHSAYGHITRSCPRQRALKSARSDQLY